MSFVLLRFSSVLLKFSKIFLIFTVTCFCIDFGNISGIYLGSDRFLYLGVGASRLFLFYHLLVDGVLCAVWCFEEWWGVTSTVRLLILIVIVQI